MHLDLSILNPVQREAVEHGEGAVLLLAGAGSGKTRVVTHRIARLLEGGVPPWRILAVTFTNKAAREMRARVHRLLGVDSIGGLTLSTFHSMGARFLRQHGEALGRTKGFVIYDDADQLATIRRALEQAGQPDMGGLAKALRRAIDQAKNRGEPASACRLPDDFIHLDARAYGAAYDDLLRRADAFDFGDLIRCPAVLLEQDDGLRQGYQMRWRHVLVDEFQDTNPAQYRLLRALAPPGSNLFVVGDDDQSIYGWRGAEVGNILRFPQEYPGATVLRLEQNYRSEGHILLAANQVIAHNTQRLGKTLWTDRDPGARVRVHESEDARAEARWVVAQMHRLRSEGVTPGEMAVLYRANSLSLELEDALRRTGMPYVIVRGRSFYERAEVKDALAYLRMVINPADDVAFLRAVNTPTRGVGRTSLERLIEVANAGGHTLSAAVQPAIEAGALKGRARTGALAFLALVEAARDITEPTDAARALLTDAGLLLEPDVVRLLDDEKQTQQENVYRLLQALGEQVREVPTTTLAEFLEQVKLVSEVDMAQLGGAVSLMTMHAAKGLEFGAVFVVGLEEGTFPSARSMGDPERIEEERRLFYVALTRAQRRLFVSHARRRRSFTQRGDWRQPSRFLGELPPEALAGGEGRRRQMQAFRRRAAPVEELVIEPEPEETFYTEDEEAGYRPGMPVWHPDFGVGEVLRVRQGMSTRLDVRFPDVGERTLMARFVSPYEG